MTHEPSNFPHASSDEPPHLFKRLLDLPIFQEQRSKEALSPLEEQEVRRDARETGRRIFQELELNVGMVEATVRELMATLLERLPEEQYLRAHALIQQYGDKPYTEDGAPEYAKIVLEVYRLSLRLSQTLQERKWFATGQEVRPEKEKVNKALRLCDALLSIIEQENLPTEFTEYFLSMKNQLTTRQAELDSQQRSRG